MEQKTTWEEIEKKYPNEWVLVADYEFDEYGQVKNGILITHSKSKEDVFLYPVSAEKMGFWYTGEGDFRGFRSHAERH